MSSRSRQLLHFMNRSAASRLRASRRLAKRTASLPHADVSWTEVLVARTQESESLLPMSTAALEGSVAAEDIVLIDDLVILPPLLKFLRRASTQRYADSIS